ncbi:MAG: xanthine dehydrogenase family protein molybdopterin-binding subunit, partial [Alicyclobacillus sp.]|nr:xanthine dehydrogenase family protein molybdopterin-binding subunit [Alicyclobacillus sp.]
MAILAPPRASRNTIPGRLDGHLKVSGQARYTDDLVLPGMLYGAVLRSPYPHARILSIDVSEALSVPGVVLAVTGKDLHCGRYGRMLKDVPVLAIDKVLFVGDRVAAVAATTREAAERAAALIQVEYEPLPAVFDPRAALAPDAPVLHDAPWSYVNAVTQPGDPPNLQSRRVLQHGDDVESALARSAHVFTETFRTQAHHQGYLEPHLCIAQANDDEIHVWAPNKAPYALRKQLSEWSGVPLRQIHVHPVFIGGDFGGKGSPMEIPLTVMLSRMTGRPVKMRMSYAEDLMAGNPRHSSEITVRLGVDESGRITALDVQALFNGGAYGGFKPVTTVHLGGVAEAGSSYRIPAVRVQSEIAYTNTVPRGHVRSPGSPQMHFAVESMIDMAARALQMDPLAFRELNMLRDGDASPMGEHYLEVRSEPVVEAAKKLLAETPLPPLPAEGDWVRGIGYSFYQRPTHGGVTEVGVEPTADGRLILHVPFPDQGAGQQTLGRNILSRLFGVPHEWIEVRQAEPEVFKMDSGCGGSRVTVTASEAIHQA